MDATTATTAAASGTTAATANASTVYNSLNLYTNSNRIMQQEAQAQYQHYPMLNQAQFYNASSHSNHLSDMMWDKQPLHPKPAHLGANDELASMPQHFRSHYYPYFPATTIENTTRNIKIEDEPPLFVSSAAEHSKITTNNEYLSDSPNKQQDLVENNASNQSVAVDDETYFEEEENDDDEDNNHARKR
ncbi:hypothetical protein [Parasitella parasitica]|uniref:Uncharacterized protein n=1 Tax=Parasitella parasitica TaxID=35722 RepID=A0A0B7MYV1_9FUNG|nr:hypothetical protein [Parasitella parasitica]